MIDLRRVRILNKGSGKKGLVILWMSRDQRVLDNFSLLYAQEKARELKVPWGVVFCLKKRFLGATLRQYRFMLEGLKEVERDLLKRNIPFFLVFDDLEKFIKEKEVALVISDFSPLKTCRSWKSEIKVEHHEVDSHNIVPAFYASTKQEYNAYNFRRKIGPLVKEFLKEFKEVECEKRNWCKVKNEWESAENFLKVDRTVLPVEGIESGEKAARRCLE